MEDLPINLEVCETFCNEKQVFPAMKHLVEIEKMSQKKAGDLIEKKTKGKVTSNRARMVYRARTPAPKKAGQTTNLDKPARKHTNPEIKKQLNKAAEAIAKGEVSDDDITEVDKAIAKAIKTGVAARRVGVSTASAVGTPRKVKGGRKKKPIDNFYRLNRHMKACIDGMTAWADGQIKPTSEDEALEATAILAKAASFMLQFARLGIDMEGIYDTFVRGDYDNEKKQHHQIELKP